MQTLRSGIGSGDEQVNLEIDEFEIGICSNDILFDLIHLLLDAYLLLVEPPHLVEVLLLTHSHLFESH